VVNEHVPQLLNRMLKCLYYCLMYVCSLHIGRIRMDIDNSRVYLGP
jgi:hypothetical protein